MDLRQLGTFGYVNEDCLVDRCGLQGFTFLICHDMSGS